MICSLILGRKGSQGFPGKNTVMVRGKPLAQYPMEAALQCGAIDHHFISTNDERLKQLGRSLGFEIIERPPHLATSEALGDDAFAHGYEEIIRRLPSKPDLLVLLFCNAPTLTANQISSGIKILEDDATIDSAVTVSKYNMFSPSRARRISSDGLMEPFVPFEMQNKSAEINCDRDSQGDVWFADVALSVVRAKNLETLEEGLLPQRWMGKKIAPIYNVAGLDIDFEWQLGQIEWWIKNHG